MKTYYDCIPCFMKQALGATRLVTGNPKLHEAVLREMAKKISTMDLNQSPPLMGREIHRTVRSLTGIDDPYREVKDFYNRFAMDMYDDLKKKGRGFDPAPGNRRETGHCRQHHRFWRQQRPGCGTGASNH